MTADFKPVFILAPPLSFAGLLGGMLGQHPELYGIPELKLFRVANMEAYWRGEGENKKTPSRLERMLSHPGLLRTVAQLYGGEQTINSIEMATRWMRIRMKLSTGSVYRELCAKVRPLHLVEVGSSYVIRTQYLQNIIHDIPSARFIHLTRHPRSQCQTIMARKGMSLWAFNQNSIDRRGEYPVLDPQILWHDINLRVLKFFENLPTGQYYHVRSEDFMVWPERVLAELCGWLGISHSPTAMEAMAYPEASPFAEHGPVNARHRVDLDGLENLRRHPDVPVKVRLEGPLEWRTDDQGFHPKVAGMAGEFGYA